MTPLDDIHSCGKEAELACMRTDARAGGGCRPRRERACAPYSSGDGMLRSSTKTTARVPCGGPYTPLRRRSSRASTCSACSCASAAVRLP